MKKNKCLALIFLIFIFLFISGRLIFLNVYNHANYTKKIEDKTKIYVYGTSAPRGRIIDVNGKVLVDNKGVNAIVYHKIKGIKTQDEIKIAQSLAGIITINEATNEELKEYWLILNNNGKSLITEEEYDNLQKRKLTTSDIEKLKLSRITDEMLEEFSQVDKKSAKIYSLMNKGYLYDQKVILKDVNQAEYAKIIESNIPGITGEMMWERVYNYGTSFKSILGSIGSIPKENQDEYLKKGYELTDIVGTSYLEKKYEDNLKGKKAKYLVNSDYTLKEVEEAKKGSDIVLSIDIEIVQEIEKILEEKILMGQSYRNTEFYKDSYAIVGNPKTGEIIAMVGKRLNADKTFSDISTNIINTSYTMGSAVKGATIAVGYQNNLIQMGSYITDSCVKLNLVPAKCSHDRLGRINDLDALAQSSNYYQYLIAINLVGKKYQPNMVLGATESHFQIYRDMLASFGLGALTEIDLPNEQPGIKGSTVADDLLLNLAIGQYDTYTPIEMFQYINSIATGLRVSPRLMKNIIEDNKIVPSEIKVLNKVNLDDVYLKRIQLGFQKVLSEGTARGFTNQDIKAAGKTGTSESFYDSDLDGVVDVATITNTFAGYFPYDDPKYSVVVITPNVSHKEGIDNFRYRASSKITRAITDYLAQK